MRDFCGQRFKDDTGKLFKDDGGKDFETSGGENSDDGEGKRTSKSGGGKFPQRQGFRECWRRFRVGQPRVAGFASKHGVDQAASAKLRGTTDSVARDVVEHDISGRVRKYPGWSRRSSAREKCCWDNEEQWVDDDWTEDKVGGQCTEENVMGENGEQETEVAGEGEHGDQFTGGAGEYEDGEGRHWAEGCGDDYSERLGVDTRGATMVGRPTATTRGITTAVTTTMRRETAMTTKRLGIEVEPSVPHWMLMGIRRRGVSESAHTLPSLSRIGLSLQKFT